MVASRAFDPRPPVSRAVRPRGCPGAIIRPRPRIGAVSRVLLLALLLLTAAAGAAATPVDLYGNLPALEDVAISPDGNLLAFVQTKGEQRHLFVKPTTERKLLGGVNIGEEKLRGIEWADNRYLLLSSSVTSHAAGLLGPRREWPFVSIYDVANDKLSAVNLKIEGTETLNSVWGPLMVRHPGGKSVLYVGGQYILDRVTTPCLFRVDLEANRPTIAVRGSHSSEGWLVDDDGAVLAEQDYDESRETWTIRIRQDGKLKPVASGESAIERPHLLGFGPDGTAAVVSLMEDGNPIWRTLSLADGSWGPPLAEGRALSAPLADPATGRLIGGVDLTEGIRYRFFDKSVQAHWDAIARAFGGARVDLASRSSDFGRVVVRVEGQDFGYAYELVDFTTKHADKIGDVYDGLTELAAVTAIHYPAKDGLAIPAFLTLPPGRAAKNLPLVVLPHGGPAARDTGGFDWWAQAIAAQGYAVLQPNYRGSDLGWKFVSAGFGEWGRKMQTDLSDGVRFLAAQGTIDPKRVCIVGASYGGYAALAGVTLDPGVYRCAVSVAGLSDLPGFLDWVAKGHRESAERFWDRFMGAKDAKDPILETLSPIRHAKEVTVPILLIHGKDDTVVPFSQSDDMADALKDAGKPVELVTLPEEDHWLSHGATRLKMLQATVAFLAKHNPAD